MRRVASFVVMLSTACALAACTQVLGIEDRSLRPGDEPSTSSTIGDVGDGSAPDDAGNVGPSREGGAEASTLLDPARAVFSTNPIDFGMVGCGQGAPANRTLTISNAGDFELDWEVALSPTSDFSIVGAVAGPVAGQGFAQVTIAAAGFPSYASAGQTEEATLSVTITVPGSAPVTTDIPITETAAGAMLVLEPSIASFGQVQLGTSASPQTMTLTNTGNVTTSVLFGSPTDSQFTLTNDAGTSMLLPGASFSGLTAEFTPTSSALASATAAITASGSPLCGVAPPAIQLTGQGTSGPIAVQPGSLDFGLVDCGAQAAAQSVKLTTTGTSSSWSASLALGALSPYTLSATSGSVSSSTPSTITVTPKKVPSTSPVTGDYYADTLTINAADGVHTIDLHESAHGAILTASSQSVAFGGINVGKSATSQVVVTNAGNASATITTSTSGAPFSIAPANATLGGDGYSTPLSVTFAPTVTGAASGTASIAAAGAVFCAPLPSMVALTGTGTRSYASVSPSSLDFGRVNCGAKGTAQNVTISNTAPFGGASFNWTAVLGKGASSPYTLGASGGTLGAGKKATLSVTPTAIPQTSPTTADYYADTLTITTDAANDSPTVVSLHETAQGVILALAPTSLDFGAVTDGTSSPLPFTVTNSGNVTAHVTLSVSPGTAGYYSVSPSTAFDVAAAGNKSASLTFHPPILASGTKTTSVTATFSQVSCGGTVTPVSATGNAM